MDESEATFQLIGNCFLIWSALVGTASVVIHTRVPWWKSVMGRHLMAYMCAFAIVLDLAILRVFFGDSSWFQLVRLITFTGVPIVMTWRLILQIKAQRDTRATPLTPPPADD